MRKDQCRHGPVRAIGAARVPGGASARRQAHRGRDRQATGRHTSARLRSKRDSTPRDDQHLAIDSIATSRFKPFQTVSNPERPEHSQLPRHVRANLQVLRRLLSAPDTPLTALPDAAFLLLLDLRHPRQEESALVALAHDAEPASVPPSARHPRALRELTQPHRRGGHRGYLPVRGDRGGF